MHQLLFLYSTQYPNPLYLQSSRLMIYINLKGFMLVDPPCLANLFMLAASFSFQNLIDPSLKSKLLFWRVGKKINKCFHLISATEQHFTAQRLRACATQCVYIAFRNASWTCAAAPLLLPAIAPAPS